MAATTTTGFPMMGTVSAALQPHVAIHRRRRIDPQAGRALEILGHAIEYLTDEFVHAGGSLCANDAQLEAVQILMALNRQIYFDCPEVPTCSERLCSLLHLHLHAA
jgi:hypothetical protein